MPNVVHTQEARTFDEFFAEEVGITVEDARRRDVRDIDLLQKAFEAGRAFEKNSASTDSESHRELLAQLLRIATVPTEHLWEGMCPDAVEGPHSRDPECPACQALMKADRLLEK